jgi:hypothetical protein
VADLFDFGHGAFLSSHTVNERSYRVATQLCLEVVLLELLETQPGHVRGESFRSEVVEVFWFEVPAAAERGWF